MAASRVKVAVCLIRWFAAPAAALAAAMSVYPRAGVCQEPGPQGPRARLPRMMDKRTVDAVELGLRYLAGTQHRDGSWLSYGRWGAYQTSMTSLAAMAFMAGGSTPEEGPYSEEVKKAMRFMISAAKADKEGDLVTSGTAGRSMHEHGFALLFLAQCYGMQASKEQGQELKELLGNAVKFSSAAQSDRGGWYYSPSRSNDEGSVTVTQLQALRACRNAGIKVDKKTIERAVGYLRHCQMEDGGICYSANSRGASRPPISAAAIACFYAAGVYDRQAGGAGAEAEMVDKLIRYCRLNVKINGDSEGRAMQGYWFYTHYYYAQAMYQRGGKDWEEYYPKVRDYLVSTQSADGSWNGDNVGTVYGTAIATIILQLPYGYLPIYQR